MMTTKHLTDHWRIQDFQGGLQTFCRKLHKNERIWTEGGVPGVPLGSATADYQNASYM